MKALRLLVFAAMLAYGAGVSHADSLKVKFTARALIDATATGYGKEDVQGYYHLEDCRAGFFANYGNYEMIADLEMAGKKFEMKVLLLNYHFKNGVLSFGNGYEPFSMDMLISTTDMRFNQMAPSVTAFTNSPRLGITYHYYDDHWYLATGLYTHNDMNRLRDEKKNALVSTTRAVWRKPSSNSPGGVPQETGHGPQSPLESPLFVAQDPSENGFGPGSGEGDERLPGPSAFPQTQPQSELGDGLTTSPRDFPGAEYWQCAFGTQRGVGKAPQNTLTQEEEAEDAPISFDSKESTDFWYTDFLMTFYN